MLDVLTMTYAENGERFAVTSIACLLGMSLIQFTAEGVEGTGVASAHWPWPWDDAVLLIERGEFPLDRERW